MDKSEVKNILKEFKERIDKLIKKQYNGYITFDDCVKECNEVVSEFKYTFLSLYITTDDYLSDEVWSIINNLRMYMLNQLMGLLIGGN